MKRVLLVIMMAACGGAKAKTAEVENRGSTATTSTSTSTTANAEHRPGSTSFPSECCCVKGTDSEIAWDGPSDCQGGTCTDQWTDECTSEAQEQEDADERNQADAECPSGDRHDCDGDGYRYGDDKDDNDPKVH